MAERDERGAGQRAAPARVGALASVTAPKQRRSERTLRRLLDAGEALIEEKGLADVSVPDIVRRAGSSVGGFYARFRDKNELLRALEERFFGELLLRVDDLCVPSRWQGQALAEIVHACVALLVSTFRERQALIRAFLFRGLQDPDLMGDALRFRRRVSERIALLLLGRRAEIAHRDPALAIDLGVQLAFGLMHQYVVFGELRAGGRRLSEPALVDELTRSLCAHLGTAAPARRRRA
jgi:AcrR family transcriptional regulator